MISVMKEGSSWDSRIDVILFLYSVVLNKHLYCLKQCRIEVFAVATLKHPAIIMFL